MWKMIREMVFGYEREATRAGVEEYGLSKKERRRLANRILEINKTIDRQQGFVTHMQSIEYAQCATQLARDIVEKLYEIPDGDSK